MSGPSVSLIDLSLMSAVLAQEMEDGSPHRRYHALEARKQHRSGKMHTLVWLLGVSFGRLAGREVREPGLIEVETHQLRHRQRPVAEVASAKRIGQICPEEGKSGKSEEVYPLSHPQI
jgi:hypothetical protein